MTIKELDPQIVWKNFYALTQIPRPSKHEELAVEYMYNWGKEHGLETIKDEVGNIIIRKPATPGCENMKGVILQGHVDMVPQKNADTVHDFLKDPIQTWIDGEWVKAKGTTLGADNGLGLAMAMAVLESDDIKHGPIELLCTIDEETGMTGAMALKPGVLQGDILINIDSETEGELYVGCAGGLDASATATYVPAEAPEAHECWSLTVKGFKGGHSGMDIILYRGNANKVAARLLYTLMTEADVKLLDFEGGTLRNAIPREAQAVLLVKDVEAFKAEAKAYEKTLQSEFENIEDSIVVLVEEVAYPTEIIPTEVATKLVKAVVGAPNGVVKMSVEMEGLVQTSTNLARVVSNGECVKIQCLLRSSVSSEKVALAEAIKGVFELAGAEVELSGSYDGWKPNMESPILKAMLASYEALYGKKPAVTAIHAGLECGIIGGVYPNLDMISFGPTICYPHSPDEKVEIASVEKFYDFLLHTLKNAPAK